ncbi:MAG: hypothetical protein ACLQPD_31165 [Desulfomonilaceae bacterium]
MDQIVLRPRVAVNTRTNDPQDDYRWLFLDERRQLFTQVEEYSRFFLEIRQGELPSAMFLSRGKYAALMVPSLPTERRDHVRRKITNTLYLEETTEEHCRLLMLLAQLIVDYEKRVFQTLAEYSEEVIEQVTRVHSGVRTVPVLNVPAQDLVMIESDVKRLDLWKGHRVAFRSTRKQHETLAAYLVSPDMKLGSFGLVLSGMVIPNTFKDARLKLPDSFWILTSSPEVTETIPLELQREAPPSQPGNPIIIGIESLCREGKQLFSKLTAEASDSAEEMRDPKSASRVSVTVRRHQGSWFPEELSIGGNVLVDPSQKTITLSLTFPTEMNQDLKPKIRIADTDHHLSGSWKNPKTFKGTLDLGVEGICDGDSVSLKILGAISQHGREMEPWSCTVVVGSSPQNLSD